MADEKKWYFAKDGKPNGPMSEHELCKQHQAGVFGPNDYVYCKGETEGWVKASTIPGLCDTLSLDAEPEPEHHEVPLHERASYQQAQGDDKSKKPAKPKEEKPKEQKK